MHRNGCGSACCAGHPRALTSRTWPADGTLVLDVDDPFLAERARYRVTIRDGAADCTPTAEDPDLSLDVRDLGSLYLGGTAEHPRPRPADPTAPPGSGRLADQLFRAERTPHCLHWF
ncbi:sterol carrier protein domain-containing protein [Amycolatopsis jejuensis]|uniref:sterol carrier protein domain-containing protein n=1 Tax=Amycolatopsis jejuensis TaxID=330084 RepID=UPI00052583F1|nr:sterol carrier protein domain-containing protein [Amycolatopsis jejuensis]